MDHEGSKVNITQLQEIYRGDYTYKPWPWKAIEDNRRKRKMLEKACRAYAQQYAQGKAIQCKECYMWLYTQEKGASSEYDVLADHLMEDHSNLHEKLLRDYRGA